MGKLKSPELTLRLLCPPLLPAFLAAKEQAELTGHSGFSFQQEEKNTVRSPCCQLSLSISLGH